MEQVLLDRGQTDAGGTELTQLLLFFVRHSGAGRIGEAGNKALAQLLTDLKRHSQKQELYLRQIVYKLGQRMEQAKDTLDWGACFRLVCLLMREIYYGRGSLPTVRAVPSCKALRQILFNQYVRLLQSDAKFLNGVSGLLDLALFPMHSGTIFTRRAEPPGKSSICSSDRPKHCRHRPPVNGRTAAICVRFILPC